MTNRLTTTTCVLLAMTGLTAAQASPTGMHGIMIAKGCRGPVCDGEKTDCIIEFGYNDDFGDTIRILEVFDVEDIGQDDVRVPDTGNLPIVAVGGNTTCIIGGSLPCEIGPGGSTAHGFPGDSQPGFV